MSFLPERDPASAAARYADRLLESDAAYFEAGARLERLPGASLAWLPGFNSLAAAGVVHRIEPGLGGLPADQWLRRVESVLGELGRTRLRLYLTTPSASLEAILGRRGFTSRTEIGFIRIAPDGTAPAGLREMTLRPVESEADWERKRLLHAACRTGPDGHPAPASDWVRLERLKVEAGYMRPFLALVEGEVCGAVSLGNQPAMARVKNLVLHPRWRQRGFGRQLIDALVEQALASGRHALGCFAVERSGGDRLYRESGFEVVTDQVEWIREEESCDPPS